jgi:hypothetical protein
MLLLLAASIFFIGYTALVFLSYPVVSLENSSAYDLPRLAYARGT